MKKFLLKFITVVFIVPPFLSAQEISKPFDWRFIPQENIGPISPGTTASELKMIFGEQNVVSDRIYIGEGFTEPGSVIFPNDEQKTLRILWKDSINQKYPQEVRISGSKTLWRTYKDITLGTSLKELELLNGKPFVLAGFAWDYEGAVISWKKGKLADRLSEIRLYLIPDIDVRTIYEKEYDSVMGDRDFQSSNKAMQKLNPKVCLIIFSFR
ncbi:MAG: hypothetical protein ABSB78_10885 [Bacteroidota bacterium]